jgi:chemotaxis protein methyltransferase CheR
MQLKTEEDHSSLEADLLVEAIYRRYGYDFRDYHISSIKRRFQNFYRIKGYKSISELIPLVMHNTAFFEELLGNISVTVTEMFRTPEIYHSLRKNALNKLVTFPFLKTWIAGAATGEEAYSVAIFLKEAGLLEKSAIYATDINNMSIKIAKKGIIDLADMKKNSNNYHDAGGKYALSDYFTTMYQGAKLKRNILSNITFSRHNLAMDSSFGEMQLIFCRNVLIYFNRTLQTKVLNLLSSSLCYNGYLVLGENEHINNSILASQFEVVDLKNRIFRKKVPFNLG